MGPGPAPFLLAIVAALLRGAAALANRTIGPLKNESPIGWDWDADDEDVDFDDGAPAIPEPGLGRGMAILFLTAVVDLAISLVLAFVLELDRQWRGDLIRGAVSLLGLVGGFILLTAFLAGMLPTTAGRAALVA